MKRAAYYFIMAFVCLFGSIANAQTAKQKVAVYVTGEAESGIKKVIGSKLVTGITKSDSYIAVERTADFLAELTKEQDYQTSGVVSDNQIVRLGQQFGVRYVLVADISEVFESMFITVRMIDVQTAQIVNSTEESATINDMESLTKLSDKIILKLLGASGLSEDNIKITGPYTNAERLHNGMYDSPDGYHMATEEEVEKILKSNKMLNKKSKVPVYTDIKDSSNVLKTYSTDKDNLLYCYIGLRITCRIIYNDESSNVLNLSYIDDKENYERWVRISGYHPGVRDMTNIPSITPGYVYWVKDTK